MLIALFVLLFFVNEPMLCAEREALEKQEPGQEQEKEPEKEEKAPPPKDVKRSLFFILMSIALWYVGYN
jgi:hypothetical protein